MVPTPLTTNALILLKWLDSFCLSVFFGYGQLSTISIPGNWPGFSHTHSEYASFMNCECRKSSLDSEAHVDIHFDLLWGSPERCLHLYPVCTHACLWAVLIGRKWRFCEPDFVWGYPESRFINIQESASLVQIDTLTSESSSLGCKCSHNCMVFITTSVIEVVG